jgi:uncharacterized phage protein (TIGR02218 family)
MKNFSAGLTSFLQTNPAYNRADLFSITPIPQNLLLWSQDFEQVWTKTSGVTILPDQVTDPLGLMTADSLSYDGTGAVGSYRIYQTALTGFIPPSGQTFTFSVWLRAPSPITLRLYTNFGSIGPGINVTTSWQRFSVSGVSNGTLLPQGLIYSNAGDNSPFTVYLWGSQLEWSSVMGPYIATKTIFVGPIGPRPASINATTSQVDITYQGVTYYASKFGAWERGKITSEASFDLKANDMMLTLKSPGTIAYPGTAVTMMGAALLGLFDAALVQVWTARWPLGQKPTAFLAANGVETKFAGFIKPNGKIARSKIEFEVADALYLLNLKLPRRIIQASCPHTLYDANCTAVATNFMSPIMVVLSGTRQQFNTTVTLGQPPPYFTQGYITFLTGQNAGLSFTIKQQLSTTAILLAAAVPLPLANGDTFIAFAGCDKTEATCNSKFAKLAFFGGTPFVPVPEVAI